MFWLNNRLNSFFCFTAHTGVGRNITLWNILLSWSSYLYQYSYHLSDWCQKQEWMNECRWFLRLDVVRHDYQTSTQPIAWARYTLTVWRAILLNAEAYTASKCGILLCHACRICNTVYNMSTVYNMTIHVVLLVLQIVCTSGGSQVTVFCLYLWLGILVMTR